MNNFNIIVAGTPTEECLIHCEGAEKAFTEEVTEPKAATER